MTRKKILSIRQQEMKKKKKSRGRRKILKMLEICPNKIIITSKNWLNTPIKDSPIGYN